MSTEKVIDNISASKTVETPQNKRVKPNLEAIAKATGVSKMTVSRVLRGGAGFSDETGRRVMQAAESLGYVPNRLAAAFAADQASTIVGVCVPELTSPLFGLVLDALHRSLSRLGYQMIIGCNNHSEADEESWLKKVLSWRPAGLVLCGQAHTPGAAELLRNSQTPVVEIFDDIAEPLGLSIGFSHFDCGAEMGRFVAERGKRRAGYIGALGGSDAQGMARLAGFRAALSQQPGTSLEVEMLQDVPCFYAGFYGIEILLTRHPDLEVVYFHNDEMAIGGLAWCTARGLRVPEDLGIAGWGAMEAASILPRRLTTTQVPATAVGKQAAEVLVAALRGEGPPRRVDLPARLIAGETV